MARNSFGRPRSEPAVRPAGGLLSFRRRLFVFCPWDQDFDQAIGAQGGDQAAGNNRSYSGQDSHPSLGGGPPLKA